MASTATVPLDDRRLVVELQSLGVRVEDETGGGCRGAAAGPGPSDAGFLWVRGLNKTTSQGAPPQTWPPPTICTLLRCDLV